MLNRTDVGLWLGLLTLVLLGLVSLLMENSTADEIRVLLYLLAMLAPFAVLWTFSKEEQDGRAYLGELPDAQILLLSGLMALVLWLIVWWAMDFLNHELVAAVGRYVPSLQADYAWGVEVLQTALLIPLGIALFVFGLLRTRLAHLRRWLAALLMAFMLAMMCVLIAPAVRGNMPTGLVGFFGYFVIGFAASLLSLHTRSLLTGFVVLAVFLYANLAFLFELLQEQFNKDYLSTDWLVPVMLCAFGVLVLSQIIRFRTSPPAPNEPEDKKAAKKSKTERPPALSGIGWIAVVILVMVWVGIGANELRQRNEEGSQIPTNVILPENE